MMPCQRNRCVTTVAKLKLWHLPPIIFCMYPAASAISSPIEAGGSVDLNGGYESNLFRRPDIMDTAAGGAGRHNPVEGDAAIGGAARLKSVYSSNNANRFQVGASGDYCLYPRNTDANEGKFKGDLEYRWRPFKGLSLKINGDCGYVRRLGIDETSDGAVDLYKYWQYGAGPRIEFSPAKSFSTGGGYQFKYYDYNEPDSGQSLDNRQDEISITISPRFGEEYRNIITIEGAYLLKKYRELLSYDANADQMGSYPVRRYHFITVQVGYKRDFGIVIWQLSDRPRYRVDAFENFYTYFENQISSGLSFVFSDNTKIMLEGAWRYRYYMVHEAMRPGPNPNLIMQYVDANAGFKQRIWKSICLVAEYTLAVRRTNTEYLYDTTYRDYTDHTIKNGVRME
jgi:hypothetical protein